MFERDLKKNVDDWVKHDEWMNWSKMELIEFRWLENEFEKKMLWIVVDKDVELFWPRFVVLVEWDLFLTMRRVEMMRVKNERSRIDLFFMSWDCVCEWMNWIEINCEQDLIVKMLFKGLSPHICLLNENWNEWFEPKIDVEMFVIRRVNVVHWMKMKEKISIEWLLKKFFSSIRSFWKERRKRIDWIDRRRRCE